MSDKLILPEHIGIIMDGNGRWAKKRGLPRNAGHKKGAEVFENISRYCRDLGIKWLTVYAFSTENWKRPKDEVDGIMNLMKGYLKNMASARNEHIAVRFIGDRTPFDAELTELMEKAENADVGEVITTVQIALNYGGRDEIVHSVREIAKKVAEGEISPESINEDTISKNLYSGTPECDLIVRPSGEERLSNFLLWESAYSEFVFMDVLWPDFTKEDLDKALLEYSKRNRRFGGV
ncbi:MAG: di-trans,poly-cis-decaprenylcistransferase [Oscillospiraceae bacterium]|nr:di-trans,poly-cis-decaprenylcistransferase [Oscillospiraceae bacterium]MBQ8789014.1 di-trans,poly-cis-decaprenylcistransferase [Oscillospiraceae bacterium]